MSKYVVMTEIQEYNNAFNVYEFDDYNKAVEFYQENSNCYYTHQMKFYKINEMKMEFKEIQK